MKGPKFHGSDLRGAKLSNAEWKYAAFDEADLGNADFSNSRLYGCTFRRANLQNTSFAAAVIANCRFESADLDNTNFCGANFDGGFLPRLQHAIKYDGHTIFPLRFSPDVTGETLFDGTCPKCTLKCSLQTAPFSKQTMVYRCATHGVVAVQCHSCRKDVLAWVEDLDLTVHSECLTCGWTSTGIPKDW